MNSKSYFASFLKIGLLACTLFYSRITVALLPPYYQTAKEITAILNDTKVAEKITSGRGINAIFKTEAGYTINAGNCTLKIKVNYLPPPKGVVGAAIFEIDVGELTC